MPSLENVSSLAIEMWPLVIGFGMIKNGNSLEVEM
jgi:hypothetical protein